MDAARKRHEERQTFSVKLRRDVVRRGRILALERGTSLQKVVESAVEDFVQEPVDRVLETAERLVRERGPVEWAPHFTKDEIHDRDTDVP